MRRTLSRRSSKFNMKPSGASQYGWVLLFLLATMSLRAQVAGEGHGVTRVTGDTPFSPDATLTRIGGQALPAGEELRLHYVHEQGKRAHAKYHQYYRGQRVLNGTVIFHAEAGRLYATSGVLQATAGQILSGKLTDREAETLAELHIMDAALREGLALTEVPRPTGHRRVIANTGFPSDHGVPVPVIAYTYRAETTTLPVDREVLVDATTGHVIATLGNVHADRAKGSGRGFYETSLSFLTDSIAPGVFLLQDFTRGKGVIAHDLARGRTVPRDGNNRWTNGSEGQRAMLDGYVATQSYHDMLHERFGRHGIDNEGRELIINMNRPSFVNAYWNGSEVTIGNGNCDRYSPLTTYEIVSHEFTHGLTQYTSGLIYQNEPGALNESISDIFGKALEYYYDRSNFNWDIGRAIRRNDGVKVIRSMANPNRRRHPAYYRGKHWFEGSDDSGGVHYNSGVLNHWFYLLTKGKSGTNEVGAEYDVAGIGMTNALNLVFLLQTAYLTESSGYAACYEYSLSAAEDLWGRSDGRYASVVEAWKAVGLPSTDTEMDWAQPLAGNIGLGYRGERRTRVCPGSLIDHGLTFTNYSGDTLHRGATVSGGITYRYLADGAFVTDTAAIAAFELEEDVAQWESFDFFTGSDLDPDNATLIVIESALTISQPGGRTYGNQSSRTLRYLLSDDPELDFNLLDVTNFGGGCGDEPRFNAYSATVILPVCEGAFSGSITLELDNDGKTQRHQVALREVTSAQYQFHVDLSPDGPFDEAGLGGFNGARATLYVANADGDRTYLKAESMSGYFVEPQDKVFTVDFSDERAARMLLGIESSGNNETTIDDETLVISGKAFINEDEDCVPQDQYFGYLNGRPTGEFTTVRACVNTAGMTKPLFTFTLKQADGRENSKEEDNYGQAVYLYVGDELLRDEPITTLHRAARRYEVALPVDYEGPVTIKAIVRRGETVLDDIGLEDMQASPESVIGPSEIDLRYVNPVREALIVATRGPLPVGSLLTLLDGTGRPALRSSLEERTNVDVSGLPTGLYYMIVTYGGELRWSGKVVISR